MVSMIVPSIVDSIVVVPLVVASIVISKASSAFLVEPDFFLRIYFWDLLYLLLAFIEVISELRKLVFYLLFHFGDLRLSIALFQKIHKFRVEE